MLPITERGTGISLPISKSNAHLLTVWNAITHEWPITIEMARNEIQEARAHIDDIQQLDPDLLSTPTRRDWGTLQTELTQMLNRTTILVAESPEVTVTKDMLPALEEIVEHSWQLLCTIDRELAGLTETQADPGRVP